jgi:hypothetical protein
VADFKWKFDVAISFAGPDRAAALAIAEALRSRGLNVFYHDWFQPDLVGQNLRMVLPEIYSTSTLCIMLMSKSYSLSTYSRDEYETILERYGGRDRRFLLPVKLDDSELPGFKTSIVHIDYATRGPATIADWAARRLSEIQSDGESRPQVPINSFQRTQTLKSHARHLPSKVYSVTAKEILDAFLDLELSSTPLGRARLARELVIYLNWRHDAGLGVGYGAWRENDKVYLSALPFFWSPQRTLEFDFSSPHLRLDLVAVWTTADDRYRAIPPEAWQPAVKGLIADRSDLDLEREVVIRILEERGAAFGFPILPTGSQAERLCGWLTEELPNDYALWSRDPSLVSEQVAIWQTGYHRETGVGILQFSLGGRWSSSAFRALMQALNILLPTRYHVYTVRQGLLRISLFLCIDREFPPRRTDTSELWVTVSRVYATIARMVAANRSLPLPPPDGESALSPLDSARQSRFEEAVSALGDGEFTRFPDRTADGWLAAPWIKLRQHLRIREPSRFNFGETVLPSEVLSFVQKNEATLTGDPEA